MTAPQPHETAALAADVTNLKEGHAALRGEVRDFKNDVANGFASIRTSLDSGLGRVQHALDTKTSTNWTPIAIAVGAFTSVMGIVMSALVAIGVAFYGGLREQSSKHEAVIESLRDRQVPRIEHERVWKEQAEDQRINNERLRRLTDENVKVQIDLSFIKGQLTPLPVRPKE